MSNPISLTLDEALQLLLAAARRAGADEATASVVARATLAAEAEGNRSVGFSHFVDYLDSLRAGRIRGDADPVLTFPAPALILADAQGGTAQLGYERAHDRLVAAAQSLGVAIFSQKDAFTAGALGWYVGKLAEEGLVGLAMANGPALMAPPDATKPVYCTNAFAFAAPAGERGILLFDQSSSATAFVNIRAAAEAGGTIPLGWAVGPDGKPTTDPAVAMEGILLTFGGARGANIALMVEVLAAGLSGGNWSLDSPNFSGGTASPGAGLFVLAIQPALFGSDFEARLSVELDRLVAAGVHIPGAGKPAARAMTERDGVRMPAALYARIAG